MVVLLGGDVNAMGAMMVSGWAMSARFDSFLWAKAIAASKVSGSFHDTISCMGGINPLTNVLKTSALMLAKVTSELAGVRLADPFVFGVFRKLLRIRDRTSFNLVTNSRTFSVAAPAALVL